MSSIQSQALPCLVFSFFIMNFFSAQFKVLILKSAEAFQALFVSGVELLKVRLYLSVGVLIQSLPLNEMLAPVTKIRLRYIYTKSVQPVWRQEHSKYSRGGRSCINKAGTLMEVKEAIPK